MRYLLFACLSVAGCHGGDSFISTGADQQPVTQDRLKQVQHKKGSWPYFLQHLPVKQAPIVDYRGKRLSDQTKNAGVIDLDVGVKDLQQCADALMRLRAEYLFSQGKHDDIGFHFTSGHYYSWQEYRNGWRPKVSGNSVRFFQTAACTPTHENLRKYLDIVYSYAGTISLAEELKEADRFEVGVVIITPGSPGHCSIIIDEAVNEKGERFFKLAEGYTPAQSIYVVSNPFDQKLNPWYKLGEGTLRTASYSFRKYELKKFK